MARLKSALSTRRLAKEEMDAQAKAHTIKQMYASFRNILACNDSTLQLIADIEDRLTGRSSFSLSQMIGRIRKGILEVYVMVRDFNELSWGRFPDLFDTLRKINREFESHSVGYAGLVAGPLVMPLSEIRDGDAPLVGRKMAHLGEIRNSLGLHVPEGFAITTVAFSRFMDREDLRGRAEKLEELTEIFGPKVVSEACRELQQRIMDSSLPHDVEEAIRSAYQAMLGDQPGLVAMRSSGVGEDREATHAGLYHTELNVDEDRLLNAYRRVLASSFGAGPVQYRLNYGLANTDSLMAVGCLRMIETRSQGIMFSRRFQDREADEMVISAQTGPPPANADGGMETVDILVSPGKLEAIRLPDRLSAADVLTLAETARRLEAHFGFPQDIEWAINPDSELYILQSRPMVFVPQELNAASNEPAIREEPILSGGATAYPGLGSGPVYVLRREDDLDGMPAGAVLVSRISSPRLFMAMNRCSAIVTDSGSPIGHMAILAREFQVPTIVGMKSATAKLLEGRVVTVDSRSLHVYDGMIIDDSRRRDLAPFAHAPAVQKLRRIAQCITPLQLYDSAVPEFSPANAKSLHDVIRFIHEKVFEVMFYFGDRALALGPAAPWLEETLPLRVLVFNVGGGLAEGAGASGRIGLADIISAPMRAFLSGLADRRINWSDPRAVSAGGFLSVLGENIAGLPAEELGVGRPSFAVISKRYMNFSTKAGYHFNTVDTYCSQNVNKNYIHFRFEGGAADETRRERRCKFISRVLEALDFKAHCRGDILVGRLEKYDQELIQQRLSDLGRLTLCCRQLDMLMQSDDSPDYFARAFLAGDLGRF